MTDYDTQLGRRLAEARHTAGLTAEHVAHAMSVTRPAVGHWERGVRSLNAGQLVQIAEILHADPHWLLTGTPQKPHAGSAHRILRAANALTTVASVLNELLGEDAP